MVVSCSAQEAVPNLIQSPAATQAALKRKPGRPAPKAKDRRKTAKGAAANSTTREGSGTLFDPDQQLDTTREFLESPSNDRDDRVLPYYRNIVTAKYLTDDQSDYVYDELYDEPFAEHLFAYYGTYELLDLIRETPFGVMLNDFARRVRRYTDQLSAGVSRDQSGELTFEKGTNRRTRLLDLRLGFSAKNGVEPKLSLFDNFNLRHTPLQNRTLVEYELNF